MSGAVTQVGEAYVRLRLAGDALAADMLRAKAELERKFNASALGRTLGQQLGAGMVNGFGQQLTALRELMNSLASKALFGGAAAGLGFAGWGVKLAADAEQAEVAFGVMLNSAEKAKALLADIRKFAVETPFEFPELRDAAKNLLAMGFGAKQVVPELRKLGDLASGLGIPIGELATLWGQFRTQGKILTGDLRQLTTRGIPAISELAKQFGVADSAILKMAEDGKIEFSHLEAMLDSLTGAGGQFAGLMEKSSQTLAGRFSTMKDEIAEVAMALGKELAPAAKEIVANISEAMPQIQGAAKAIGETMSEAFSTDNIKSFTTALLETIDGLRLLGAYFAEAQLGAARLGAEFAKWKAGVQYWTTPGEKRDRDIYDAVIAEADAGVARVAERATMIDPQTGRRVNRTDFLLQHFGERAKQIKAKPDEPKQETPEWLQKQFKGIENFGRERSPLTEWATKMADFRDKLASTLLVEVSKVSDAALRGPSSLLAAGAAAAVKGMRPGKEQRDQLAGGFSSFENVNRSIQESLIRDKAAEKTAANTSTLVKLQEAANESLAAIKTAASKSFAWIP